MTEPEEDWFSIQPKVEISRKAWRVVRDVARKLDAVSGSVVDERAAAEELRDWALERALSTGTDCQPIRLTVSALVDLHLQGWSIAVRRKGLLVRKPTEEGDAKAEKDRVREALLVERDRQLAQESTRRFIVEMETRRLGPSGWTSIYSLMRDGPDLAQALESTIGLPEHEQLAAVGNVVQPYLQLVDDAECEHTGMRLRDVWRYFRHTWSSPYKSVPGRSTAFLVRDGAAPNHPIIGIGSMGSAFMQLGPRDSWIGWDRATLLAQLRNHPTTKWARWILGQLDEQIAGIFRRDFVADGLLCRGELSCPTEGAIERLRRRSAEAKEAHRRFGRNKDHKGQDPEDVDWAERARTPLFVAKRAALLADLLEARMHLNALGFTETQPGLMAGALKSQDGRRAIGRVLKRWRDERVGNDVMDLVVCGAVAPYNHLLGGKLVALLLASPEALGIVEQRYRRRAAVIASGLSGRPVRRRPKIVLLGTTSLYGIGSSQYNRLRMPASAAGGATGEELRFEELGKTQGYGSYHFSERTMTEARALLAQNQAERRARNIFGEGGNPRWRGLRDALDLVGLPSGRLLKHGSSRVVYGIRLARNTREILLGQQSRPNWILPRGHATDVTKDIVMFWMRRWLVPRLARPGILERVADESSTTYPIAHGARVSRPVEVRE